MIASEVGTVPTVVADAKGPNPVALLSLVVPAVIRLIEEVLPLIPLLCSILEVPEIALVALTSIVVAIPEMVVTDVTGSTASLLKGRTAVKTC